MLSLTTMSTAAPQAQLRRQLRKKVSVFYFHNEVYAQAFAKLHAAQAFVL
jgi:hypothetical protein